MTTLKYLISNPKKTVRRAFLLWANKPIRFNKLLYLNIALLWLNVVFHELMFRSLDFPFTDWGTVLMTRYFGLQAGSSHIDEIFWGTVLLVALYNPYVTIFHIICRFSFGKEDGNFLIAPKDMKFQRDGIGDNIARFITYAMMCLTPYFVVYSIMNARIIIPFIVLHMLFAAFGTFTHGMQLLAMYRIFKNWAIGKLQLSLSLGYFSRSEMQGTK